jgi:hypothetical protein
VRPRAHIVSEVRVLAGKTKAYVTSINSALWYDPGEVRNNLTRLSLDSTSSVVAPAGKTLAMTVDGAATAIAPGQTYAGAIVLTVQSDRSGFKPQ